MPVSQRGLSAFEMLPPPVFPLTPAQAIDVQTLAASIPREVELPAMTNHQVEQIAWDMVMVPERKTEICSFYGLDAAQWGLLSALPSFQAGTRHAAAALKSDPNLAARMVARGAMTDAVRVTADLARSSMVEPKDRLKAVELLARIVAMEDTGVGAENRRARTNGGGSGATVNLNFGNVVGTALRSIIVERDE